MGLCKSPYNAYDAKNAWWNISIATQSPLFLGPIPFNPMPTATELPAGDGPFLPPVVVGLQVAIDREMAYRIRIRAPPWQSAASKGKGSA